MVQVVFNVAGSDDKERKVQASIATLLKKKLSSTCKCNCASSHVVVTVGGAWRTGDFEIKEMTACCMESLAAASDAMAHNEKKAAPISRPTFGQAAFAADGARGLFTLR